MSSILSFLPARWWPQSANYEPLPLAGVAYHLPRRRLCVLFTFVVLAALAAVSTVALVYDYDTLKLIRESVPEYWSRTWDSPGAGGPLELNAYQSYVVGPPALEFRGNLRNDTKYVTTWTTSGWTNNLITFLNMIYIALLTDRIPIVPPFAGGHLPDSAGPIDFGTIFDIPRLSRAINRQVLDWREVKNYSSPDAVLEDLGCWSVWATSNLDKPEPRNNKQEGVLKLDVSYTPVPARAKLFPDQPGDVHVKFWGLAELGFPNAREKAIGGKPAQYPSKVHKHTLPPDDQLLCFDFVYFASVLTYFEYETDFGPAWRFVGTHLHWSSWIESLGNEYLRRALDVPQGKPIPPYIGMHLRRDDFKLSCQKNLAVDKCFAPLDAFVRRVAEVRAALANSSSFSFTPAAADELPVIVTSDDSSPEFLADIAKLGWLRVDHDAMQTDEKYGLWYGPILDAYFQSAGVGFVGTDRSTMSLLALRRVVDWRGGEGRMVKWGRPGADSH